MKPDHLVNPRNTRPEGRRPARAEGCSAPKTTRSIPGVMPPCEGRRGSPRGAEEFLISTILTGRADMKTTTGSTAAAFWILLCWPFPAGRAIVATARRNPRTRKSLTARLRRPMAVTLLDGDSRLLVANRQSGSISVIDPGMRRVLAEHDVGRGLADIVALPDDRHVLAVDQAGHDILLLNVHEDAMGILARVRVAPDPVRIVLASDGSSCVVASLWSRRLTFLELTRGRSPADEPSLKIIGSLDLPLPA